MVRRVTFAATGAAFCDHCCILGLCWSGEAVMGDAFWCRHLVAMRGALLRTDGAALERLRIAARGIVVEAISRMCLDVGCRVLSVRQRRCNGESW
jgi:hypothetical protein